MINKFQAADFIRSLKNLSLTEGKRSRMREELMAYADLHAVHEGAKQNASRTAVRTATRIPAFSFHSTTFSTRLWYGVTAFVLIFTITGGGAAFASENTLPGDALYPLKVSVAEPVQGALISTPEGKAKWHSVLAERRLEEATTLATENKLTPDKQEYLSQQFTDNVQTAGAVADALGAAGNTDASLDIHSDLEARLTAHADILGLVADHLATATSTADTAAQTDTLLAVVEQSRDETALARMALEDQAAITATSSAESLAIAAQDTGTVQTQFNGAAAQGVDVPAAAHDVATAQSDIATAAGDLSDNPTAAYHKAHDAARASQVAAILLDHAALLTSIGIASTTIPAVATTTETVNASTTSALPTATIQTAPSTTSATSTKAKPKTLWMRLINSAQDNTQDGK